MCHLSKMIYEDKIDGIESLLDKIKNQCEELDNETTETNLFFDNVKSDLTHIYFQLYEEQKKAVDNE